MDSLLRPSYALTVGRQQWTCQAGQIDVSLAAAPGPERLLASFPAAASLDAAPDDPVELVVNIGDGDEKVFTGILSSLRRGLAGTTITAVSALGRLARRWPSQSFENATAGTIIRDLADAAGVETGSIADGITLRFYVADPSRNAAEHALRLASWSGAMLMATPEGKLSATVVDASRAEIALRYGREISAFHIDDSGTPPEVTVAGESGVSDAGSADSLRLTTDFFGSSGRGRPRAGQLCDWEPALRTTDAASSATAARRRGLFALQRSGHLKAFLQPRLRPGAVIEIQDLPSPHSKGPYRIEAVRHRISADGATTSARLLQGGDSFDPMGLLGSLMGML
jgi:hypothetical protein